MQTQSSRNPAWTRDELILTLDLYFAHKFWIANSEQGWIAELSNFLNELPVHSSEHRNNKFRNFNGVYMKLSNFLNLDPIYPGKGLSALSQLDRAVWDEFSQDRPTLRATANAIRENFQAVNAITETQEDDLEEFREGKILTRLHTFRERDRRIVKKKKDKVWAETGKLACEVCSFDFAITYGELGVKFAECHHTKPLYLLRVDDTTRLSDLAIVCANCHRMLHRGRGITTIQQLRRMVRLS